VTVTGKGILAVAVTVTGRCVDGHNWLKSRFRTSIRSMGAAASARAKHCSAKKVPFVICFVWWGREYSTAAGAKRNLYWNELYWEDV